MMHATVYVDPDPVDVDINHAVLKRRFEEQLERITHQEYSVTVYPNNKLTGRRPLLVLDGGLAPGR